MNTMNFKRISHFLLRRLACFTSFISPNDTRVDKFLKKPEKSKHCSTPKPIVGLKPFFLNRRVAAKSSWLKSREMISPGTGFTCLIELDRVCQNIRTRPDNSEAR